MTNSTNGIQRDIKFEGQKLGTVTSFKYLGATVSYVHVGSKLKVLSRIEANMERQQHISLLKGETDVLTRHIRIPVPM